MNNILDIYERLYKISDNIIGETIDYNRGFQDAVYMLQLALKKYEHVNMHIENKKLRRKLLITDVNFDDALFTLSDLRSELDSLKSRKIGAIVNKSNMVLCELEIGEIPVLFFAETDQQTLDGCIHNISDYIVSRLSKGRRNGKARHPQQDYKVWAMEYLRNLGIKCVA